MVEKLPEYVCLHLARKPTIFALFSLHDRYWIFLTEKIITKNKSPERLHASPVILFIVLLELFAWSKQSLQLVRSDVLNRAQGVPVDVAGR